MRSVTLAAAVVGALMVPLASSARLVEVDTTSSEFLRLDQRAQVAKAEAIRIEVQGEQASGAGGNDTAKMPNSEKEMAENIHDACIGKPELHVSQVLKNFMTQ